MENDKCKTLWDFTVQTDQEICGRRSDFIVVRKDKNLCQIIYILIALLMEEWTSRN